MEEIVSLYLRSPNLVNQHILAFNVLIDHFAPLGLLVMVDRLLQYEDSISGCRDSQQFSFPRFATVLVLSTPVSAPS